MANDRDYRGINFGISKKDYDKIEKKIIFTLMYFVMKINNTVFILFMYQNKNLKIMWIYY